MDRFLNTIAITTTLVLAQSCSLLVKDEGKPISAATHQHQEYSMGDINHREHSKSGASDEKKAFTLAKLKLPSITTPNKSIPILIDVKDLDGKAIGQSPRFANANFDTFQEKLMHLILVSDDLQFFNHLHPIYKENGQFEVAARFPQAGGYTFFSDYKPAGQTEQVSVLKTQVTGKSIAASEIDLNRSKTFNDTKVNLTVSEPTVKAGKEVTLMFKLQNAFNNQPLTDLQPYLGERGHLVILRQSTPLKAEDYVHAHALKDAPVGQVHFMTSFPQPGKYKLWGQFNRNGKIVTVDFWINAV